MLRFSRMAILGSLLLHFAQPDTAGARTWVVDDDGKEAPAADFSAVSDAVAAAADGDTIVVQPGHYLEMVSMGGKNIHLRSTSPGDPAVTAATIIDANREGSGVIFRGSESSSCILEGFTILNGFAKIGGGINGGKEQRTAATIRRNILMHNAADQGGGIASCAGEVSGNSVVENSALEGGGMYQCGGGTFSNEISRNVATTGGGMYLCSGYIQKNIIRGNTAQQQGGAIVRCSGYLDGNLISENSAEEGGALLFCNASVTNNRIILNHANVGGAFYECKGLIADNTIIKNGADFSGGAFYGGIGALIRNNDIVGNFAGGDGGAMANGTELNLQGNRIELNTAIGNGGALSDCSGTFTSNTLMGNTADIGGALAGCTGRIDANRLDQNGARIGGAAANCAGLIQNNLIQANLAVRGEALDRCDGTIQNNTFAFNGRDYFFDEAEASPGAVVYLDRLGVVVRNNIFYRNDDLAMVVPGLDPAANDKLFLQNNDFFDPGMPILATEDRMTTFTTVAALEKAYPFAQKNLLADPNMTNPFGPDGDRYATDDNDLTLTRQSPCVDAGRIEVMATMPVRDLVGNARFIRFVADLGCYEQGSGPDTDGDGVTDVGEIGRQINPQNIDTDGDGLTDAMEFVMSADPRVPDAKNGIVIQPGGVGLQEAVLKSYRGDSILLMPGTYYDSATMMGKELRIVGVLLDDPPTVGATIIDAGGTAPVIALTGTEGPRTTIQGVTLQHGRGIDGSAVYGAGGPVSILYCNIFGNTAMGNGALSAIGGEIAFCHIANNIAANGGGIADAAGVVHDNLIEHNKANIDGGGVFNIRGNVIANIFNGNSAKQLGGGGSGIFALLTNNSITSNTALSGGGMHQVTKTISGNAFINNIGREGGGLYRCQARIEKNQFLNNQSDTGAGMEECIGDVIDNTIMNNRARVSGGAIITGSGTYSGNRIEGNSGFSGGAFSLCRGAVTNNIVRGNTAETNGGAMTSCNSNVSGNLFENNRARNGGALHEIEGSIQNNTFRGNTAMEGGGGVNHCEGKLNNNLFANNSAADGGAVNAFEGAMTNNQIQGNTASGDGGGVANSKGEMTDNLIQSNSAKFGGAIQGGRSDLFNNTIASNTTTAGGAGGGLHDVVGTFKNNIFYNNARYAIYFSNSKTSATLVQANDFWGSGGGHYVALGKTVYSKVTDFDAALAEALGNFEFDPLFVSPRGPDGNALTFDDNNLRLHSGSPAIDKGTGLKSPPAADLDGHPRISPDGGKGPAVIDLGAYEYLGVALLDPAAPIKVHGGDRIQVRWQANPDIAGTTLRFEVYDGDLLVGIAGTTTAGAGSGTALITIPDYLWKNHPYRLRMYSTQDRTLWSEAPGTITLVSGSTTQTGKDTGASPGDLPRNGADVWMDYQ